MDLSIEMYGYIFNLSDVNYEKVPGTFSRNADSDMDYYGWEDLDFNVKSVVDTESGLELKGTDFDEVVAEHEKELESKVKGHFSE